MGQRSFLLKDFNFFSDDHKSDMIREIRVPRTSYIGNRVNLTCFYNETEHGIYSLKWYHNDNEFYRHIPTEKDSPVEVKSAFKFSVHVSFDPCVFFS